MAGLVPGARASLDGGVLSLYVLRAPARTDLVRAAWQVVAGRAESGDTLDVFRVEEAVIVLRHARIEVALDGEVTPLETPLRYRIRKRALRVLVPPPG